MEYKNLQDNISPEIYNDRISGIANWIDENRDKKKKHQILIIHKNYLN